MRNQYESKEEFFHYESGEETSKQENIDICSECIYEDFGYCGKRSSDKYDLIFKHKNGKKEV